MRASSVLPSVGFSPAFAFQAHGLDAASTSVLTQVLRLPSASIGAESSDSASVIVSYATSPAHHRLAHTLAAALFAARRGSTF